MSCLSLTIINKNDDYPIYLRDFSTRAQAGFEENIFGLSSVNGCSVQHSFLLQLALKKFNRVLKDRKRKSMVSTWVGLFLNIHRCKFYGYISMSGLKIIAGIDGKDFPGQMGLFNLKETGIKLLLVSSPAICNIIYTQ